MVQICERDVKETPQHVFVAKSQFTETWSM